MPPGNCRRNPLCIYGKVISLSIFGLSNLVTGVVSEALQAMNSWCSVCIHHLYSSLPEKPTLTVFQAYTDSR